MNRSVHLNQNNVEELIEQSNALVRQEAWNVYDLDRALFLYRQILIVLNRMGQSESLSSPYRRLQRALSHLHMRLYEKKPHEKNLQFINLLKYGVPVIFQRNRAIFQFVLFLFIFSFLFSFIAVTIQEDFALKVLPAEMYYQILSGKTWLDDPSRFPPPDLLSFNIILNNTFVSIYLFGGGITLGILTFYIFLRNIFMLGALISLSIKYGVHGVIFRFILAHGILEISGILIECLAGFVLIRGLIWPGVLRRREALDISTQEGITLFLGTLPWIVIAGVVEGFISPRYEMFSMTFRIVFGILLASLFWFWLFRPVPEAFKNWHPAFSRTGYVHVFLPEQWQAFYGSLFPFRRKSV